MHTYPSYLRVCVDRIAMLVFVETQQGVDDATRSTLRLCLSPTPRCFRPGAATAISGPNNPRQPETLFAKLCTAGCARRSLHQDLGNQAFLDDVSNVLAWSVLHLFTDPFGLIFVEQFVLKPTDVYMFIFRRCYLLRFFTTMRLSYVPIILHRSSQLPCSENSLTVLTCKDKP
jgi:hypothetical protein